MKSQAEYLKYFENVDGCEVLLISDGTKPHQKLYKTLSLAAFFFLLALAILCRRSFLDVRLASILAMLTLVILAFLSVLAEPQPTSYLLRLKKEKPPKPSPVGFTLYHWKDDLYWAVEIIK